MIVNSQTPSPNRSLYKSLPTIRSNGPDRHHPHRDDTERSSSCIRRCQRKTMKELVELIRSGYDKYHGYAPSGLGTPSNLSASCSRLTQNLSSPRSRSAAAAR